MSHILRITALEKKHTFLELDQECYIIGRLWVGLNYKQIEKGAVQQLFWTSFISLMS